LNKKKTTKINCVCILQAHGMSILFTGFMGHVKHMNTHCFSCLSFVQVLAMCDGGGGGRFCFLNLLNFFSDFNLGFFITKKMQKRIFLFLVWIKKKLNKLKFMAFLN
jgi:hypothetical protein